MITIEFSYKNPLGIWMESEKHFQIVDKAVRFIYVIQRSPKMVYMGFSCTDPQETEEMNRRI